MTEDQIKYMVDRFLGWKLPRDTFNPDCGISFDKKPFNTHTPYPSRPEPSGTNLFDATQATAMVRYMLEGLPRPNASAAARLREAVTHLADVSEAFLRYFNPATDLQIKKANGGRYTTRSRGRAKPSPHPHASDCDKQGWLAKDVEAATKRVAEWNGETTKSEGGVQESPASNPDYNGVKSPALVTAHGLSGQSCPLNQVMLDPSDRTADVTVEDIALVLLDGLKAGKAPIQIARALLDAYGMWRR